MNVNAMVYPVRHMAKPGEDEIKRIPYLFKTETIPIVELLNCITRGYTIRPGILGGGIDAENWKSQQVFFVDVDNKNPNAFHRVRYDIDLCEKLGIVPVAVYASFSYTFENQKHHMVFVLEQPITDPDLRWNIQYQLNRLFDGDTASLLANSYFFGGPVNFFPNYYPHKSHLLHPDSALFKNYEPAA